jgi:hypothetical protein
LEHKVDNLTIKINDSCNPATVLAAQQLPSASPTVNERSENILQNRNLNGWPFFLFLEMDLYNNL